MRKMSGSLYHIKLKKQMVVLALQNWTQANSDLVGEIKIDKILKERIHTVDIAKEKLDSNTIKVATGVVSLFSSIPPKEMAEHLHQDNQLSPIIKYVKKDQRPPKKFIWNLQIRSNCCISLPFSGIGSYSNKELYISCISLMRLSATS